MRKQFIYCFTNRWFYSAASTGLTRADNSWTCENRISKKFVGEVLTSNKKNLSLIQ